MCSPVCRRKPARLARVWASPLPLLKVTASLYDSGEHWSDGQRLQSRVTQAVLVLLAAEVVPSLGAELPPDARVLVDELSRPESVITMGHECPGTN